MITLNFVFFIIMFIFFERCLPGYSDATTKKAEVNCECGKHLEFGPRIVGGKETRPHEYPWMTAILYNGKIHCGGSLINDRYILTAGHCLKWTKKESLSVILGLHDRILFENHRRGGVSVEIDNTLVHEKFSSNELCDSDDIGLIKLKNPVKFTRKIKPVCLPRETDDDYSGKTSHVIGWGRVSRNGGASRFLKQAKVSVISNKNCKNIAGIGEHILESMLCAYQDEVDACQGDSGGPLFFKTKKGNIEQIGVVSWGIGCAEPGIPGVYTRLSSYIEWITSNTKDAIYCKNS